MDRRDTGLSLSSSYMVSFLVVHLIALQYFLPVGSCRQSSLFLYRTYILCKYGMILIVAFDFSRFGYLGENTTCRVAVIKSFWESGQDITICKPRIFIAQRKSFQCSYTSITNGSETSFAYLLLVLERVIRHLYSGSLGCFSTTSSHGGGKRRLAAQRHCAPVKC